MQDVGPYGDIISSTSTALFFFQGINNGLRYLSQGVLNLNRSKKGVLNLFLVYFQVLVSSFI